MTEADTCRKFVVSLLQKAGRDNDPHSIAEQRYFTAGRIVSQGPTARRRPGKRADYLLRYTRDLPLAVVEAKAAYKHPADGLQQAKDYATIRSKTVHGDENKVTEDVPATAVAIDQLLRRIFLKMLSDEENRNLFLRPSKALEEYLTDLTLGTASQPPSATPPA